MWNSHENLQLLEERLSYIFNTPIDNKTQGQLNLSLAEEFESCYNCGTFKNLWKEEDGTRYCCTACLQLKESATDLN